MKSSREILKTYLDFMSEKGHKLVPNVSLVPENDPTLLFVNSGMFPLVPYLSGEKHPLGSRVVNVQRCLRFDDLEEVGDYNHTVAFHMIGNWSLGDYFKKEQLPWIYEFFVEKLELDPQRIFATVFEGDSDAPRDTESIELLKGIFAKYGIKAEIGTRIYAYGKKDNWWKRGEAIGELGGPDSEVFYYLGEGSGEGKDPAIYDKEYLEIGNSVFMQYKRAENGWEELSQRNVDFGGGLERIALAVQDKRDIFETDNFWPIIEKIQELSNLKYHENEESTKCMRILADHIRAATFLAMDNVKPSNKDQGYVLRRILRRMVRTGKKLGIESGVSVNLVSTVVKNFSWIYPELEHTEKDIVETFALEEEKFRKVLNIGAKEAEKSLRGGIESVEELSKAAFDLFQSVGYPMEMFLEDVRDKKIAVDLKELNASFENLFKQHQAQSRQGAEQKFKGGLADHSEQVVKFHTATHLLHWALREVLGKHVKQMGSNITGERARFDFSHHEKLTEEEVLRVENLINEKISEQHNVSFEIMSKEEAEKTGAMHFFGEKYGDEVKVYYIGKNLEHAFSKEFCGGPHVQNLSELGQVKIEKQKSLGKDLQRVYLVWA